MIGRVFTGKVAVKKEDLQKYHGKDTWFQLQPVSADSEVQVGNASFSLPFTPVMLPKPRASTLTSSIKLQTPGKRRAVTVADQK